MQRIFVSNKILFFPLSRGHWETSTKVKRLFLYEPPLNTKTNPPSPRPCRFSCTKQQLLHVLHTQQKCFLFSVPPYNEKVVPWIFLSRFRGTLKCQNSTQLARQNQPVIKPRHFSHCHALNNHHIPFTPLKRPKGHYKEHFVLPYISWTRPQICSSFPAMNMRSTRRILANHIDLRDCFLPASQIVFNKTQV